MRRIFTFLFFLFLIIPFVRADGFSIYTDRSDIALHGENTQIAAISWENGTEKMIIAAKLEQLYGKSVVWIVPVAANASEVNINIVEDFPRFSGSDIVLRAEEMVKGRRSTIDGIAALVSISQIYTFPFAFFIGGFAATKDGVEVYEHIEKGGIVSEVVTADNANALYDYLTSKNITVSAGSLPILEDYIGQNYSFVVSWITAAGTDYYRIPGIFVEFPTDKLYYPLKPTSIYGDRAIPIVLYVVGWANPQTFSEISADTHVSYVDGGVSADGSWLGTFYSGAQSMGDRYTMMQFRSPYTKITIGEFDERLLPMGVTTGAVAAKNFVQDLWIERLTEPPAEVTQALATIDFLQESGPVLAIIWLILASVSAGCVAGFVVFRKIKRFGLTGLANCLTIIGLIIAALIVARHEPIRKRIAFIIVYSLVFLVVNFLVIAPIVKLLI